jgi:response regulator NasT
MMYQMKQQDDTADVDLIQSARKVLLVDADSSRASLLQRSLMDDNYEIVSKLGSVDQLLHRVREFTPDILIMGLDSPDPTTLSELFRLHNEAPLPIIMFAEKDAPNVIQEVVRVGVSAYVAAEIHPHRLNSLIALSVVRFNEQQKLLKEKEKLRKELERTKTKLADRKKVDRAKGLLMDKNGISEDEAYNSLRKMAMDKGQTLVSVAENVIDVLTLFESQRTIY